MESNTPDTEKTPQFVMLTHDWIESWLPKLSGSALKVYVALRYHSDRSGRKAYPSYNLLHRETGLCREAIAKALADLESQRIITVNRAPKRVNHYRFPPVKSSSEIEPPGSETRPENSGSLVRKPDQSSSEIELNLVRKPDGNHSKEPDKATKNKSSTKKPIKPKEPKPKTTIKQRTAWLNDSKLSQYKRNARGATGIWIDAYHVASKHPPRKLTAEENGQLRNIWADALASGNDDPEQAIRLVKQAIKQAWVDHRAQDRWRAKEPPTTAGVHRHWNTLIASNVKAEIPPKPVVYPQEEWFAKSKEEQTRLTKYRIEWYEKYGTNDD